MQREPVENRIRIEPKAGTEVLKCRHCLRKGRLNRVKRERMKPGFEGLKMLKDADGSAVEWIAETV